MTGLTRCHLQVGGEQSLMQAGLDSLGAVELRDTLATQFALDIPATLIFDRPTAAAIAASLSAQLSMAKPLVPTHSAAATAPTQAVREPTLGRQMGTAQLVIPAGPGKDEVRRIILETLQELVGLQVQPTQPLMDAGLDSLGAVELRSGLGSRFSLDLPATAIFDYPSADALADFISKQITVTMLESQADSGLEHYHSALDELAPAELGYSPNNISSVGKRTMTHVMGMSCRYPGALAAPEGFWTGLKGSLDLPQLVPLARWDTDAMYSPEIGAASKIYARFAACVGSVDLFDAAAFRMSASESMATDPQVSLQVLTHVALDDLSWVLEHDNLLGYAEADWVPSAGPEWMHGQLTSH